MRPSKLLFLPQVGHTSFDLSELVVVAVTGFHVVIAGSGRVCCRLAPKAVPVSRISVLPILLHCERLVQARGSAREIDPNRLSPDIEVTLSIVILFANQTGTHSVAHVLSIWMLCRDVPLELRAYLISELKERVRGRSNVC
jgi:hypothetical protein